MTAARRTAGLGIALGLGVTLLVGCAANDGGDETTAPSATEVEPTPDATPTETPPYDGTAAPEKPADMASDSHLGARAAATYLFEVRNWAIVSGDATALEALCDPTSIFCSKSIAVVHEEAEAGITSSGGIVDFTITDVLPPNTEHEFFEVRGTVDQEPITRANAAGEMVEVTQGADELPYVVFVEHVATGGWIVRGADLSS